MPNECEQCGEQIPNNKIICHDCLESIRMYMKESIEETLALAKAFIGHAEQSISKYGDYAKGTVYINSSIEQLKNVLGQIVMVDK